MNNPPRIELKGVGVNFGVPGAFSFDGKVAFFTDEDRGSKGFRGDIELKLEAIKCTIDGKLIIGQSRAGYTHVYVLTDADFPTGIPLFSTGAAIYGFQGLLGVNMEPNRKPEEAWYEGWYKKNPTGATDTSKWWDVAGSFAIGFGATIGTAADDGFSVNTKTLLILVLPGPIIILEGKGSFLKQRPATKEVTAEGAFTALLVLDGRQRIFQMNLEARYNLVKVINVYAGAEAFFDFDHPWAWHLFLGQKEPEEKRIQVKLLDLFGANAYWMMWKDRLEVGAWYGYKGGPWEFGPLSATLEAWMSGEGLISRNPEHFEALIQLYGLLQLRAFGAGIDIGLDAGVEGRGPTPWEFDAWIRGMIRINLVLKTIELMAEVHLHYEEQLEPQPARPLLSIAAEHFKTDEAWEIPFVESTTPSVPQNPFPIIPPDARPVITFTLPVYDDVRLGMAKLPDPAGPEVIRPGKYEFRYCLRQVELLRKVSGVWNAISAAAYIQSVRESTNEVILSHPLENGSSFKGGNLVMGESKYEILNVDGSGTTLTIRPGKSAPQIGPCLLITKAPSVTGNIMQVKDNSDGTSTVTVSSDLPGDANAYADSILRVGVEKFKVIGNTKRNIDVLDIFRFPNVILPTLGPFELKEVPAGASLYGQWLPTDQADPSVKTKMQLWSKTPYTYFRRNDPSVVPPVSYDVCGPDVEEEPVCVGFDALPLGTLNPGKYQIDGIAFDAIFSPQNAKISVVDLNGHHALHLDGRRGPARIEFTFEPLLDMIEVNGGAYLKVSVNFVIEDGTVTTDTGTILPSPVGHPSSVKFVADSTRGQIQSLEVKASGEKEGVFTQLCSLPGWNCVGIPPFSIPSNATDVDMAGIKFSGKSQAALAIQGIMDKTREFTDWMELYYLNYLSRPYEGFPGAMYMSPLYELLLGLNRNAGDIFSFRPEDYYHAESLDRVHTSLTDIKDIRDHLYSFGPDSLIKDADELSGSVYAVTVVQKIDEILSLQQFLDIEGYLTIRFPRPVTRVRISMGGRILSELKAVTYGGTTKFFEAKKTISTDNPVMVTLDVAHEEEGWIDRVEISGLDPMVYQVCYDGSKFAWSRKEQYERRQQWRQQLQYWYSEDNVLEPNREYCIRAVTFVTNMDQELVTQYWHGFFKAGFPPLGRKEGKTAYPEGGVLADLSAYIARSVPEGGAGEKGKRPPYRGYDVGVEFNENYVDRLYHQAKLPMAIRILDNNGKPVAEIVNYWGRMPVQLISEGERKWKGALNLSDAQRCGKVDWSEVPGNVSLLAGGERITLLPETLHRAELVAKDASMSYIVHSFEFTTSRFVNFIHHMHSFEDRAWEIDANAPANLSQLFQDALTKVSPKMQAVQTKRKDLKDNADKVMGSGAKPTEADFKAYDDALKQVSSAWIDIETEYAEQFLKIMQSFGLTGPNAVRALEISVVKSGNTRHAILLESPEPIDWRRTKIKLRRSPTLPVASISLSLKPGSTIKISSVRLPTQTDADYWVEIFARDETTLDGYKLEITEDAPLPPFKLYFTFPQGTILRAGKRLRIGPTPAARREWGIGYLTGEQTQLTAKTTWIRLSDNTGQVIHLQVVQPDANYAAPLVLDLSTTGLSNGLLLPNADGTRTLLLLKDLAGLAGAVSIPNGAYSLIFEFLRDIGQEAPVLREAGLTTLELATLLFSLR